MKAAPASRTRDPDLRWLRPKPVGALRLAFRLPIYLYRLDLGRLLGHRFLPLVHRGRESGLLREAALEALLYGPATKESVVLSAWGEKADWYRNVASTPALEVRTGGERYVPEQKFLVPEESHAIIADYGRRHPLAFRVFARVFGYPLGGTEAARREFAYSLRLVAFRPRHLEGKGTGDRPRTLYRRPSREKRMASILLARHSRELERLRWVGAILISDRGYADF